MSPVETLLRQLVEFGQRGHDVLDALLAQLTPTELAALVHDWTFWARPNQLVAAGPWRSHGFMAGRGWGKSRAAVSFALDEIDAGRARRVALVGPGELKAIEILVTGESGVMNLAPPWLAPVWASSSNVVQFANGAIATVYSAEAPDTLRGPEHDVAIATELAAWPPSSREEAFSNLRRGLRLGQGKLVWDTTPRRRNPLLRQLLAENAADPRRHVVVRGETRENAVNLAPGVVSDWYAEIGGTARGAEELEGRFFDEAEDALFRQAWIDAGRRPVPAHYTRRIVSVDPAITSRAGSDSTGIVEMALAADQQIFVLANHTAKHTAAAWTAIVLDCAVREGAMVLIETNRGGSVLVELLRHTAQGRGQQVIVLGASEVPSPRAGVVYVREVHSRGQKAERAEGASALVEKGRISFVPGRLGDLEDRLTMFDGSQGKPDDAVDAFVMGVGELMPTMTKRATRAIPRAFPTAFRGALGNGKFQF